MWGRISIVPYLQKRGESTNVVVTIHEINTVIAVTVINYMDKQLLTQAINDILDRRRIMDEYLTAAANSVSINVLGNGFEEMMGDHGYVHKVKQEMITFDQALDSLKRLLTDHPDEHEITIDIESFRGYMAWFLNGFFVDYVVHTKLNEARIKMSQFEGELNMILTEAKIER
jgi:hypothetical protein